jgi:hypothetical protein
VRYVIQIEFPSKPVVEIELDLESTPAVGHVIEFFGNYELKLKVEVVEHGIDFPSMKNIDTVLICSLQTGSQHAINDFLRWIQ